MTERAYRRVDADQSRPSAHSQTAGTVTASAAVAPNVSAKDRRTARYAWRVDAFTRRSVAASYPATSSAAAIRAAGAAASGADNSAANRA